MVRPLHVTKLDLICDMRRPDVQRKLHLEKLVTFMPVHLNQISIVDLGKCKSGVWSTIRDCINAEFSAKSWVKKWGTNRINTVFI